MMKSSLFLAATSLCLGTSTAFTAPRSPLAARSSTSLSMKNDDAGKTFAASALAAAYLFTGVVSADAAFAMDAFDAPLAALDSSSVVMAARSGGRAGGRAAQRMSAPPSSSKTVINRSTTVIQAPPVVVGGGYGYGGYGYGAYYDPTPGIALNLGLSAVSAVGNGMREYRQTEEIARSRAELSAARDREAEMSERIRALEQMQMQKGGQQPQAIYYAQPPVQQMAPVPVQQ
ncbi:hypothetical protein HJC23_005545 [Cyclotella cryptica]|uniref:Uncharacterized protein n=1 Tax=Cyclotella cryptica TaxID=29204 RepID=A0ABD3PX55_9STRA